MNATALNEQRLAFEGWLGTAAAGMGVSGLLDGRARIVAGARSGVGVFFSHADFPGLRFGYRAKAPGEDRHELVWLAEELATGALHRLLRPTTPAPDDGGTIWLHLDGQVLRLGT